MKLYTIGHGNLALDAFLDILRENGVDWIADVRSSPYSRMFPWFNKAELVSKLRTKLFGSVRQAFGAPFFLGRKGNGAFKPETGDRSLATVEAASLKLSVSFGSPRIAFRDSDDEWREVPLQDLAVRTHLATCPSCQTNPEELLRREFEGGPALLRVGLTRIWAAEGGDPACWLQINHIFLTPSQRRHFL